MTIQTNEEHKLDGAAKADGAAGINLAVVDRILAIVRTEIGADIRLQTLATLVAIAQEPGLTLTDIQTRTGLTKTTATRTVQLLASWQREGVKGHGLVIAKEDSSERRRKRIYLTNRGKQLALRIANASK